MSYKSGDIIGTGSKNNSKLESGELVGVGISKPNTAILKNNQGALNSAFIDFLKIENGRLTGFDTAIKQMGYKDAEDFKKYKEENPELFAAMGGVKYEVGTIPEKDSEVKITAINNLINNFKNTDIKEIESIIKTIGSGEWQDAETMNGYTDKINRYVNNYVALESMGYFNHLPEEERKANVEMLKEIKNNVQNKKNVFANYEDAESYNLNFVWANKYGLMTWTELEAEQYNIANEEELQYVKNILSTQNEYVWDKVVAFKKADKEERDNILSEVKYGKIRYEEAQNQIKAIKADIKETSYKVEAGGGDADYYIESSTENTDEYVDFAKDWYNKNGTIQGARAAYGKIKGYVNQRGEYDQTTEKNTVWLNCAHAIAVYEIKFGNYENMKNIEEQITGWHENSNAVEELSKYYTKMRSDPNANEYIIKGKEIYKTKDENISDEEYEVACYYLGKGEKKNYYFTWLEDVVYKREVAASGGWSAVTDGTSLKYHRLISDYTKDAPIEANIMSVALNAGAGAELVYNLLNGEVKESKLSKGASKIREAYSNAHDGEFLGIDHDMWYNTAMSAIDSLAANSFGNGGPIILAFSAAASGVNDALARGMTGSQALLNGLANGVNEYIWEKFSLGQLGELMASKGAGFKTFFKELINTTFTNASEEAVTEIANILYDTIFNGELSHYKLNIRRYMQSGLTEEESKDKAKNDILRQIKEAADSGALMGLGFGTIGNVSSSLNASQYGKNYYGSSQGSINALIQNGLAMPEGSDAYNLAVKAQAKVESGKKVSGTALYNLSTAVKSEIETKSQARLAALGVSRSDIKTLAPIVAKAVFGESLTVEEQSVLSNSKVANQVVRELSSDPVNTIWKNAVKDEVLQSTASDEFDSDSTVDVVDDGETTGLASGVVQGADGKQYFDDGSGDEYFGDAEGDDVAHGGDTTGENTKDFQLNEPSQKDIARAPSAEEAIEEAITGKQKTNIQRHIVDICKQLGLGITVEFVESLETNGKFIRSQNKILIRSDLSAVQMYIEVFKHEFMHRLETKQLYSKFFDFCFKKSKAFEQYVRAELKAAGVDYNVDTAPRDSVLDDYTKYKFNEYKNAEDIPQKDRDAFTKENAQEEIVADFFAQILFQGEKYRSRIIEALENADGEALIGIGDEVSSEAALMELQQKEPTLFEQVIEFINNIIEKLRNWAQGKTLVNDLESELDYLEDLARKAYQSKDSKWLVRDKLRKAKYSLVIKHTDGTIEELADARDLTDEQAVKYLNQAKKGALKWNSYIPVRKDTPATIIDTLKAVDIVVENRSLVMQVRKVQQAMSATNNGAKSKKHGNNIRSHAMSAEQIVEIVNNLDNPTAVILQTNRYNQYGEELPDNVAVFVEYNDGGNEGVAIVEFDSSIDPEFIGIEIGDTNYHTVVTIFEPDIERGGIPFDYIEELLLNPDNYELEIVRRQPARSAIGKKRPNTSSKLPSDFSISKPMENVKYAGRQPTRSATGEKHPNTSSKLPSDFSIFNTNKNVKQDNIENYNSGQYSLGSPMQRKRNSRGNDNVEKYNEEQYNNFGWVRYNDILSVKEYNTLLSRYADYMHNKNQYPTTRFGEAVIHSSECPDVLMYVKGKIGNPQITKVVRINIDEYNASVIKEEILRYEYRQVLLPYKNVEAFYGEGLFNICRRQDCISFRGYRTEQERRFGKTYSDNNRTEFNGRGSVGENTRVSRADSLSESAFSLGLSEPDINNIEISEETEFLVGFTDKNFSKLQKHIIDIVHKLDSNLTVEFSNDIEGNGKYIRSQNKILVRSNLSAVQMYVEVFKHEFMHRLETKQLYGKFFDYCFDKSKAFEQYVRAELKSAGVDYNVDTATRVGVIEAYTKYKFDQYKNSKDIPKADRDKFTMENAKEEIVADFFAQILFHGEKYRTRIIEALENADGEALIHIGDEVSSEAALMELQQKEPTLFEQVIEFINNIIEKLRNWVQGKTLVSDLENEINYLEHLARKAYHSKDSKRLVRKKSDDIRYSIKKSTNGKYYVEVENNIILENNDGKSIAKILSDIVKRKFKDYINISGQKIGLNSKTAREWQYSKDSQYLLAKSKQVYIDKLNAFNNADELLKIAKNYIGEAIKHQRKDNFVEFARGTVDFKVSNRGYSADVIVGTTKSNVTLLYDIVGLQKKVIEEASHTAQDRRAETTSINNIIHKNDENVNDNRKRMLKEKVAEKDNKATSDKEVAFSMPSKYSYEALINKPDIKITLIDRFNVQTDGDTRKGIIDKAIENAVKTGNKNENGNAVVYVKDIDSEIILSKSGLRHGLDRRFELLAPIILKSGEILSNAIRINELIPRVDNIRKSYVLIGVAKNAKNEMYIVSFVVNKFTSEVSDIDVLYAINAKTEPAGSLSPSVPVKKTDYFTGSTISISKLLDYVNRYFPDILPEGVLRYYGYEGRPEGKIGESALFSMPIGKRKKGIENEILSVQEQSYIEKICNELGVKVVFEDLREMVYKCEILSPDGYIEKEKGIIHLNLYAQNPIGFILKHELTHFGEKSSKYDAFVSSVKKSKHYKKWLSEKTGESDVRIAEYKYKQMVANTHSDIYGTADPKAQAEMIADFVGEMLFAENGSGMAALTNDLNTKHKNAVIKFVLDFISYVKKKLSGITSITFELSRLEDSFIRMISDSVHEYADVETEKLKYDEQDISFCFARCEDENLISKAEELEKEGIDGVDIFKQLGVFRNVFGEWVTSIDLDRYRFYPYGNHSTGYNLIKKPNHIEGRLRDIVIWPELYEKFPEFEDVKIVIKPSNFLYDKIKFIPDDNGSKIIINQKLCDDYIARINIDAKVEMVKAIQHMIQFKEGNYIGKSYDYWKQLEEEEKLPFSQFRGRRLTADEMMTYFIDNYDAHMASRRQFVKYVVTNLDKKPNEYKNAFLYLPYISPDDVIVYGKGNKLVSLSEKNGKKPNDSSKETFKQDETEQEIEKSVIKETGETTQKIKDFVWSKEKKPSPKFRENWSRIKGGNSGFLQKGEVAAEKRFENQRNVISKTAIANEDTLGRKLLTNVKGHMDGSIAINEKGQPISLYTISLHGDDVFKQAQLGLPLSTIDAAVEKYNDTDIENISSKKIKCLEFLANVKNPFRLVGEPYELSVNEIGMQLVDAGYLPYSTYLKWISMASAQRQPEYNNHIIKKLREHMIEIGFDSIVYENQRYDKGSMTLVVFDESQLIPVAKDGILIENNGIEDAIFENYQWDENLRIDGVKENNEKLARYIEEPKYNLRKVRKQVDERIKMGDAGYFEKVQSSVQEAFAYINEMLNLYADIELSGYDNAGRKFTNKALKKFKDCKFKDAGGDILTFCLWNTKPKNISQAAKMGVEFGTVNAAFKKFFNQKESTFQCYNGVFEEFILNCCCPLVLPMDGWNCEKVAKFLLDKGEITQIYYDKLISLRSISSPTYVSDASQILREKIKTQGYDCIVLIKSSGEKTVIPLYDERIIPISQNGILNQECDVYTNIEYEIDNPKVGEVISQKRRTIRDFSKVKDIILSESNATKKLKHLTEFLSYASNSILEENENINVGYSGPFENIRGNVWKFISVCNKLISDAARTIKINEYDTAGRYVEEKTRQNSNDTIFKDDNGKLLSFFFWNKYGERGFKHSALGYNLTTLTGAHDMYLAEREKYPQLKNGEYEEYYVKASRPYVLENVLTELTPKKLAEELYKNGVLSGNEFRVVREIVNSNNTNLLSGATRCLNSILTRKGYDCIIYMNGSQDAGGVGIIAFNESQLVPVSVNGQKIENNVERINNKLLDDLEDSVYNENIVGLTLKQKQRIKEKTGWSDAIIDFIRSMEEAQIYIDANLTEAEVNGRKCLIRSDIDVDYIDNNGVTNIDRIKNGKSPLTKNNEEIQLHHIGQKQNSPLAELTRFEHLSKGNYSILHDTKKASEIDRIKFAPERKKHWETRFGIGGHKNGNGYY